MRGTIQRRPNKKKHADAVPAQLSPASIRNHPASLGRYLKHASQWGYLRINPRPLVEMPKLKHQERRIISPDQVGRFLEKVPKQPYSSRVGVD
ncbi:MAG: hypothetical protein QGI83_24215 [Candidatus Latescibacteria bacterium]|jgi:site-specific recombinase XerD|nr:hypothetical protein [Candidatus Latescibacterota bacterium]